MGLISSGRKPRRFDYEPRFYNPEEDEKVQRRQNIKRRMRIQSKTRQRRDPTSLFYLLGLLAFAIYIYTSLG